MIHTRIDQIEYDFKSCFRFDNDNYWAEIAIPLDENEHLKAQYDLIQYILNTATVLKIAMKFPYGGNDIDDQVEEFLNNAFKPMIDLITDAISIEMINMEEAKILHPSVVQNIHTVQGNAIQQTGTGTINATANTSTQSAELIALIEKLYAALENLEGVSDDDLENVRDDMDSLKEQILSASPKPNRMKKALDGIKRFGTEVLVQLTAGLAVATITTTDWQTLIQQAETYIAGFLT